MDLKIFTNQNTSIEHADACPALFEMAMIGSTNRLYGTILPSYKIGISHLKDSEVDYISLIPDQKKIGKTVISEYLKDKNIILDLYQKWEKEFGKMMTYYYDFFVSDLSQLSDADLLKKSNELQLIYSQQVSMPGFIDGFMFYAETRFNDLIKKFCKKNKITDPVAISSVLTSATSDSFLNEAENDLIAIAKKFDIKNIDTDKDLQQAVQDHLFKYSYIKSSYAGYKEYTEGSVLTEVERVIAENKTGENLFTENKQKKLALITKYNLSDEIIAIVELSDILIKWQDQRKQYTLTFVSLKSKILHEYSKRSSTPFDLIIYSLNSELKDILSSRFDLNVLKSRKSGALFVYKKGLPVEIITGEAVDKFMEQISATASNDIIEIKGSVASVGKAQGLVKIVTSMKYLDKIEEGDILVAPMTRPEYLIGMRKAAAIVTDDGGITCHAAIVSRELKKPCIIGTKISTKTLRDGDLVEVDANVGVVKILKRA